VVTDQAYAVCLDIARRHYENFPVASRLVPPESRRHIAAIYAFARAADDFADEGDRPPEHRLALLADWGRRLSRAACGRVDDDGSEAAHVFTALAATMKTCGLEQQLLADLLSAFRQDVIVKRYETWEELLDYCRRSANPIGRLVLRVSGYRDDRTDRYSDAVCTALQLTNFWQDLERDWINGRVYVPRVLSAAHHATEHDLERRQWSAAWQGTLRDAGARTRALFADGRPVADLVRGRLRYELRATWLGGTKILDRLDAIGYNVFGARPHLGPLDAVAIAVKTVTWRRGVRAAGHASAGAAPADR
jgi:phytoene synthase